MNPSSVIADLRALGPGAPVRAAYEASKRIGLHTLVFDRLVPPKRHIPTLEPVLGPRAPVPGEAVGRTVSDARHIVDGTVVLFGREIDIGRQPDWHLLLHTEGRWPVDPWWRIDIRSPTRAGDVKWAWELGRHRHLVILARAAYLVPEEDSFATTLHAHLHSWIDQNPPERGVHWYSNLEIALRAISWLQVLALVGDRLDPNLTRAMAHHLYHSGRHLAADLPYTVSTMRNNHLLGDGLGLVALGRAFPHDAAAQRWGRLGDRLMTRQLGRHIHPDGSMIEDSLSYHRFVLEMLSVRAALGEAPRQVMHGLVSGARFLARLGVGAGPVPQYGDWDEGRVLASSGEPGDVVGAMRLAAALGGSGAPPDWRRDLDELTWYAVDGLPAALDDPVTDGRAIGGGIGRAVREGWTVWLKAGSERSHGHADLTSISVLVGDRWVVGDPGTGTYNGDPDIRNYFRTSIAHSVLRLDGEDQLVPHRAFRWATTADGIVGEPLRIGTATLMWGAHNAYRRLPGRPRVARVILFDDGGITVGDWVEGRPRSFCSSLPLHPEVSWKDPDLELPDGHRTTLDPPGSVVASRGSVHPFDGWWSETYGALVPATRLECRGMTNGPVPWSIRNPESPPPTVDGQMLVDGDCQIQVGFTEAEIVVIATSEGETARRHASLAR